MTTSDSAPDRAGGTPGRSADDRPAVQAVIFDLDGVLAETEPLHMSASRSVVAPRELPTDEYLRFVGAGWQEYVDWIVATFEIPADDFEQRYTASIVEALRSGPPPMMPGANALVRAILRRDVPVAVASMSKRVWVEPTLDAIGMRDLFPLVVTSDEVGKPKPDPEVYLQAAALLGIAPEECMAVEDSAHGVASAAAAGMWVVQLRQSAIASDPHPAAHAVIDSFRDFDLRWIEGRRPGALAG